MNFELFHNLSNDDAAKFLAAFLDNGNHWVLTIKSELSKDEVNLNFDLNDIEAVMDWFAHKLKVIPDSPDQSLPDWIKNSSSYKQSLFSFDEPSKDLILKGAYYFGESFVKSNPRMSWNVGDKKSAVKNMPVVKGFNKSIEMSPIMVIENLFNRILHDGASSNDVQKIIGTWKGYCRS